MPGETDWWRFVQATANGRSNKDLAHLAGIDPSALSRWKRGERADVYFVVKYARGLGLNVLEALVAAGFITEQEASLTTVVKRPREMDKLELFEEVVRRAREELGEEERILPGPTGPKADDDADLSGEPGSAAARRTPRSRSAHTGARAQAQHRTSSATNQGES